MTRLARTAAGKSPAKRRRKADLATEIPPEARGLRLLSPRQVATITGLGERKVYSLISSGDLPSVLISSRCRRIALRDLEAWIDARREGGAA